MAYLVIKKDNQVLQEYQLNSEMEHSAGRSKDCNIHLDEATVSRQHLKIFFRDNAWHVQTLSKYSPIYLNNEPVDYSQLKNKDTIKIANYTFTFFNENAESTVKPDSITTSLPKEDSYGLTGETPTPLLETEAQEERTSEDDSFDEKTFVPESASNEWSIGIPYIIVRTPDADNKTLRLEGDYWVIGRDEMCDILVDDAKSSREHCEIYKKNSSYYIQDKGSSNGTLLNGNKINFKKEYSLKSGDNIQIGQAILTFEIRDPNFKDKLSLLPAEAEPILTENVYQAPVMYTDTERKVVKIKPKKSKNSMFYAILGILVCVLFYGLTQEDTQNTEMASSQTNNTLTPTNTSPIDSLAPDQKEYVEKTYVLAQNLYKQGKYELAIIEVEKIHSMVPEYKDTKDILKYSKVAIDTLMEQQEIKRQEDEQIKLAQKVNDMIDNCDQSYRGHMNSSVLDQCLASVEELDPENIRISQLRILANQNDAQKEALIAQKEAYKSQVNRRKALYDKANTLKKSGKILDAISAHNRNIASTLPDPENLESKSKQEIQALQKQIQEDMKRYSSEAEAAYNDKNYKVAIRKLEDAIKLNPQDADIKSQHAKYSKELFSIVKALYGDSVLEENLGNIESAKEKWKKIQSLDVEYGEYFKKSKTKLKKYGS